MENRNYSENYHTDPKVTHPEINLDVPIPHEWESISYSNVVCPTGNDIVSPAFNRIPLLAAVTPSSPTIIYPVFSNCACSIISEVAIMAFIPSLELNWNALVPTVISA